MSVIDDLLASLFSFVVWGIEILAVVVVMGTMGAWYGVNQLTYSVAGCMATEGGYTTDCAQLLTGWSQTHNVNGLVVQTPDGAGAAPVPFGQPITLTVTRNVGWSVITIPVRVQATEESSYVGTGPQPTYTNP